MRQFVYQSGGERRPPPYNLEMHDSSDKVRSHVARLRLAREEIVAVVGLLTSVTAFVILVRERMYLVALVLAFLFMLLLIAACVYVVFARSESIVDGGSRVKRFSRRHRMTAIAVCCSSLVVVWAVLLTTPGREFLATAVFDAGSVAMPRHQVAIVQLQRGMAGNDVVFDITLRNSLNEPVLVKKLALSGVDKYADALCSSDSSLYRIGAGVTLSRRDGRHFLLGRVTKNGEGVEHPVRGFLFDTNCTSRDFVLAFDTSEVVGAHEYATFRVLAPSELELKDTSGITTPPLRIGAWKSILFQCVLDRSNTVVAASFGPMPSYAADYDEAELRWAIMEALHQQ